MAVVAPASRVQRQMLVADGLALVQKQYEAGLRMGRHVHDEWRFCLSLQGSYTDSWRRGHRTRTPRQLSLHPADEVHTSEFHAPSNCFHIAFTGGWRERLLGDFGIADEPHEFLTGRVPMVAVQLYDEFRQQDACSPLVIEGLACELIGLTARTLRRDKPGPSWVYDARDLLRDRFQESLTLHDIASVVDVHPVHLARTFRRTHGCSVGAFVRRQRVEFACRQIDAGAALADVAHRAGFSDQSHFTRVFKRAMRMTPLEYRGRR